MKKKSIIQTITAIVLLGYLTVAVAWSVNRVENSECAGVDIRIDDPESSGFVTQSSIKNYLSGFCENANGQKISEINLNNLSSKLNKNDRIESVAVTFTPGNKVRIDVVPMKPVARIFDNGKSYYINRDGKHISADCHYHLDVPIIQGHFNDKFQPTDLFPLLDFLQESKKWREGITMISANTPSSIALVPAIKGHIIQIGDITNLKEKFDRISLFYEKVLPKVGWEYYEAISVKWKGQIVATKRNKPVTMRQDVIDVESEQELPTENADDIMDTSKQP